ncbi:MAG: SIS domain-containing protein [Deferribacteraceae bacterium]|jgi:phosphoheptose isomerase|nr:SIS domain-containing protein [Deferribacteraceae bacterium]
MNRAVKKHFQEHADIVAAHIKEGNDLLNSAAGEIASSFLNEGKLYTFGSGISSLLANYAASLFINRCRMFRPPLPAIFLRTDASVHSYQASGYSDIFEKQISALATPQDIIWGITQGGIEESIICGMRTAAHNGVKTISLSGKENNALQGVSDIFISVDTTDPLRIHELHLLIINAICDRVDEIMFNPDSDKTESENEEEDSLN